VVIAHVRLPKFTGFPVLIKQEVSGVFIVLVQIVIDATLFGAGDINQLFKFRLLAVILATIVNFAMFVSFNS
jgi:hypothetical protein